MDAETLKYVASMGVGGSLAAMMFFVYRKDMKVNSDAWQGQSSSLMTVVKENTSAITALIELVREMRK